MKETKVTIEELVEEINAGLKEDESTATAAAGENSAHWRTGSQTEGYGYDADRLFLEDDGIGWGLGEGEATPTHAARHDPARVLAEVAAKQQLLDTALAWPHDISSSVMVGDFSRVCPAASRAAPCDCGRDERVLAVLQTLATPYRQAR